MLECCADSVESVLAAEKGGAGRIELCGNLVIGGTTPSLSLFEVVREKSGIRLHILIRPRFGDFLYSGDEFEVILREVARFQKAGADGVAIGCLRPDGTLDMPRMRALMEAAGGMSVTLHRAFDMCRDASRTLEEAVELGVDTILTSGQKNSSLEGAKLLTQLVKQAEGRIEIMAGAGVSAAAVEKLLPCGLTAFHMSGKRTLESGMSYRNPEVNMGLPGLSEYEIFRTDEEQVRAARRLLDRKSQEI